MQENMVAQKKYLPAILLYGIGVANTKRLTSWERKKDKTEIWEFNHISNGYDANATMTTKNCDLQKRAWKGGEWRGIEGHSNWYNVVKNGKVEWTDKV